MAVANKLSSLSIVHLDEGEDKHDGSFDCISLPSAPDQWAAEMLRSRKVGGVAIVLDSVGLGMGSAMLAIGSNDREDLNVNRVETGGAFGLFLTRETLEALRRAIDSTLSAMGPP